MLTTQKQINQAASKLLSLNIAKGSQSELLKSLLCQELFALLIEMHQNLVPSVYS
jgi:hypothetical protein